MNIRIVCIFLCVLVVGVYAAPQVTEDRITMFPSVTDDLFSFETEVSVTSNFDVERNGNALANNAVVCVGETVSVDSSLSATFSSSDYEVFSVNPRLCEDTYRDFAGATPRNVPIRFDNSAYDMFFSTNERFGSAAECYEESACWGNEGPLRNMPVNYYGNVEDRDATLGDPPAYPNTNAQVAMLCSLEGSTVDIVNVQTGRSMLQGGTVRNTNSVSRSVQLDTPGTYRIVQAYDISGCAGIVRHPACGGINVETAYSRDRLAIPDNTGPVSVNVPSRTINLRVLGSADASFQGSRIAGNPNEVNIQRWDKGYVNFEITNTGSVPFRVTSASLAGSNGFDLAAFDMQATCNQLRQDLGIQNCGYNEATCRAFGFTNPLYCGRHNAASNGFNEVIQPGESRILYIEVTPEDNLEANRDYPFTMRFDQVITADSCNEGSAGTSIPVIMEYEGRELSSAATCELSPRPFRTFLNQNNDITITCRNDAGAVINCGNDIDISFNQGTNGVSTPVRVGQNPSTRVSTLRINQLGGQFPSVQVQVDGGAVIGTYACSAPIELGAPANQEPICAIIAVGPDGLDVQRDGLAPGHRATFGVSCVNARGEPVNDCQVQWSSSNQNVLRASDGGGSTEVFTAQAQVGVARITARGNDPEGGEFSCTRDISVTANGRRESCEILPPRADIQLPANNPNFQYVQDFSLGCYDAGLNFVDCREIEWTRAGNGALPNLVPRAGGVRATGRGDTNAVITVTETNSNLVLATCNAVLEAKGEDAPDCVQDAFCDFRLACSVDDPDCDRCDSEDEICEQALTCIDQNGNEFPDPDCQFCDLLTVQPANGAIEAGQLANYGAFCGVQNGQPVACENVLWDVDIDNPQSIAQQNQVANRLLIRAGQGQGRGLVSARVDGFDCRNTQPLTINPQCGPLDGICPGLACIEQEIDFDCPRNDGCGPNEVFFDGECLFECPGGTFPNEFGECVALNDECAPGEILDADFNCVCPPGEQCGNNNDEDDPTVCRELRVSSNQVQPGDRVRLTAICGGNNICDNPRIEDIDPEGDSFEVISRPNENPIVVVAGQNFGTSSITVRVGRSICPVQPVSVVPFVCLDFT